MSKSPCISLMTMICLVLNWLRLQLALKWKQQFDLTAWKSIYTIKSDPWLTNINLHYHNVPALLINKVLIKKWNSRSCNIGVSQELKKTYRNGTRNFRLFWQSLPLIFPNKKSIQNVELNEHDFVIFSRKYKKKSLS